MGTVEATALAVKRYLNCPKDDIGIRNKETGSIEKEGKDDIRRKIRQWLNHPDILENEQFKTKIIDKFTNYYKEKIDSVIQRIMSSYGESWYRWSMAHNQDSATEKS
jgi:hypothetical protein